jgi:hypothetical protein
MIKYNEAYDKAHVHKYWSLFCNRSWCNGSVSYDVLAITVVANLFTVIITLQSCNMELYNDYFM